MLEFDEFMKIPGCKEGKHLFVGSKKDEVSLFHAIYIFIFDRTIKIAMAHVWHLNRLKRKWSTVDWIIIRHQHK